MVFKVFQNGTALTAQDINDVLVEQGVITFADAAARDNAIPAPNPGMHCHLLSTEKTYFYDSGSGWLPLAKEGGAPGWVTTFNSSANTTISATAFTAIHTFTGGPVVSVGRPVEVEFNSPFVTLQAATTLTLRIMVGTTAIGAGFWSNASTTTWAMPAIVKGEFVGTGAALAFTVEAMKGGTPNPVINPSSGINTTAKYRLGA